MIACLILALLGVLAHASAPLASGCPNRAFLGCILALKEEHIQFDRNIVRTILSIDSEAKLLHTCKAYTKVLPCFRDKVLECGNQHQRELFGEVGRALMFLCSPFSLQRQRVLVEKQNCISKVLSLPISVGCKLAPKPYGKQLLDCKKECAATQNNFSCSLKTWMSEQNACTLNDISENCGQEAADFYADFQASVFEPNYPFLCHPSDKMILPFTTDNQPKRQNVTVVTVKHKLGSRNFTRAQLSMRKMTKAPRLDVFYVSPRSDHTHHTTSHIKSREIFNRVYKLSTKAPEVPPTTIPPMTTDASESEERTETYDRPEAHSQPQIPQVQQTFMALVEKLLPIALQHNMTTLLQHQNKLLELSRKIDLKEMLSKHGTTTTTTRGPFPSSTTLPTTTTTHHHFHSGPAGMATNRPWRPWYFVSTDEGSE